MKRIVLLFVAFITIGAFAQEVKQDKKGQHHEDHSISSHIDAEAHAMMYADKVTTRLNLNLEQKDKIQEAQMQRLLQEKEMMSEMMAETSGQSDIESREMEIEEDFKAEIKKILNPSQYKKWEEMHDREMKTHYKNAYESEDQN
ncbi:hypothetical protein ML462_15250 [Gramella lutea]|uniref:Uncharacterized protein n=1 Tax=Christiangramia lutea TaxID=1607951 RepID=A0A9X1V8T6_9FLAO|nr:hypothetical protein [Christiangramia lutea]MCH4824528.1 hypothetical protein [Christiangramia lutea]